VGGGWGAHMASRTGWAGGGRVWVLALGAIGALAASCARSGSVSGDLIVTGGSGAEQRAAHVSVTVVRATQEFEQDWQAAMAAFEGDAAPARQLRDEAARSLEHARLAWSKAVGTTPSGGRRTHGLVASGRQRDLWGAVRAAEKRLAAAEQRLQEVARTHDPRAAAILERHAAQRVETDASGHYVFAALPPGPAYVYARFTLAKQHWVWFRPIRVPVGILRQDLTSTNAGGWPFT